METGCAFVNPVIKNKKIIFRGPKIEKFYLIFLKVIMMMDKTLYVRRVITVAQPVQMEQLMDVLLVRILLLHLETIIMVLYIKKIA